MAHIAVGIDIGSASVRVVVCEYVPQAEILTIKALVKKPSRGLRHGYILNVDEVASSIKEAVTEAEKIANVRIKNAYLALGGTSLGTLVGTASIVISRPDNEVTEHDVARVSSESEASISEKQNFKILHTIPLEYKLDGKKVTGSPIGYHGNKLETKTLFITVHQTHMQNSVKSLEKAGVEIDDIIAAPIAESVVTLSPLQKSVGCILVNIGSETVSVVTFEEGSPISLQVFPIGSTDVTNDIALGFKIPLEEAEALKLSKEHDRTTRKKIEEIIEARLSDMFELVELHLKKIGRNGLLPAGVIITGGGSFFNTIHESAKRHLNLPARVGSNIMVPENFKITESKKLPNIDPKRLEYFKRQAELIQSPEWSVAYGLCIIAMDIQKEESGGGKFMSNIKSKLLSWVRQFLP